MLKERRVRPITESKHPAIQLNFETVPKPIVDITWREEVTVRYEGNSCKDSIIDLVDPFSTDWSGLLEVSKATQLRISLVSKTKPVQKQPHQASLNSRELKSKIWKRC